MHRYNYDAFGKTRSVVRIAQRPRRSRVMNSPIPTGLEVVHPSIAAQSNSPVSSCIPIAFSDSAVQQLCALMAEQMRQQQFMMQQLFAAMNINRDNMQSSVPSQRDSVPATGPGPVTSTVTSPAQVIKLSNFGGTNDENIEIWVHKVESVAEIHGVSQEIMLLAATG